MRKVGGPGTPGPANYSPEPVALLLATTSAFAQLYIPALEILDGAHQGNQLIAADHFIDLGDDASGDGLQVRVQLGDADLLGAPSTGAAATTETGVDTGSSGLTR